MQLTYSDTIYSPEEWRTLALAYFKACRLLDRDPRSHHLAERVVRTIMILYERGEHGFGRLATMAAKREHHLSDFDDWADGGHVKDLLFARTRRPLCLH